MIKITTFFTLLIISSCGENLPNNSKTKSVLPEQEKKLPKAHNNPESSEFKNEHITDQKQPARLNRVNDKQRQHGISEEFSRDNFNYENLAKVDWTKPETYGDSRHNLSLSNNPANISPNFKIAGITPENYYHVNILGDGNCWLRASWVSFLLPVLDKEQEYLEFIDQLYKFYEKFKEVPGFSHRYFAQEFKQLIEVLKKSSPKKRLELLNKSHVDDFLNYTLRSLIHAENYLNKLNNIGFSPETSNNYIKSTKWSNPFRLANLFIPSQKNLY